MQVSLSFYVPNVSLADLCLDLSMSVLLWFACSRWLHLRSPSPPTCLPAQHKQAWAASSPRQAARQLPRRAFLCTGVLAQNFAIHHTPKNVPPASIIL